MEIGETIVTKHIFKSSAENEMTKKTVGGKLKSEETVGNSPGRR